MVLDFIDEARGEGKERIPGGESMNPVKEIIIASLEEEVAEEMRDRTIGSKDGRELEACFVASYFLKTIKDQEKKQNIKKMLKENIPTDKIANECINYKIKDLERDYEKKQQELKDSDKEINVLKDNYKNLDKNFKEKSSQLNELEKKLGTMNQELKKQATREKKKRIIKKVAASFLIAAISYGCYVGIKNWKTFKQDDVYATQLTQKLPSLENEIFNKNLQLSSLETKINELEQTYQEKQKQLPGLEKNITEKREEFLDIKENTEKLKNDYEKLNVSVKIVRETKSGLEREIANKSLELNNIKENAEKLKNDYEKLNSELQKTNYQFEVLKYDIRQADSQLKEIKEEIRSFSKDYYELGLGCYNKGNFLEARKLLSKSIELDPNNGSAIGSLGLIYLKERIPSEAEGLLEKAVELNPNEATFYYNLGLCYSFFVDKREKVAEMYNKAIKLSPSYAPPYLHLGDFFFSIDNEKSLEYYERFIELGGGKEIDKIEKKEIEKRISKLKKELKK